MPETFQCYKTVALRPKMSPNVGVFSRAKEIKKYLNFVSKRGVMWNVLRCFIFGRCCEIFCYFNHSNRWPNITEMSSCVLAPVPGVVSLTFRELSKIFSRNLCIAEIALLMRISSWNFIRVPKACKVSAWNSHNTCDYWHCKCSSDYFGELTKR